MLKIQGIDLGKYMYNREILNICMILGKKHLLIK